MIHEIQIKDAATRFHEIIFQSDCGDEFIIMMDEEPVAKLISMKKPKPKRRLGTAKGQVVIRDDFKAIPEEFGDYIP